MRCGIAAVCRGGNGEAPATDGDGEGLEVEGDVRKHQGVVSANLGGCIVLDVVVFKGVVVERRVAWCSGCRHDRG